MIEEIINNINYRLNEETLTAEVAEKSGGYEGAIVIPETVVFNDVSYRVTTIGEWAFCDCKSLTGIIIPNSVMTIGSRAFQNCTSLSSITIPNSVMSIEAWAFAVCRSLTSIAIPNSVTSIGENAFYDCESLSTIQYAGTIAQWEEIILQDDWNNEVPAKVVHCTDDDVKI